MEIGKTLLGVEIKTVLDGEKKKRIDVLMGSEINNDMIDMFLNDKYGALKWSTYNKREFIISYKELVYIRKWK